MPAKQHLPPTLTAQEAAQLLGHKIHQVYALLRSGQICSVRIGRSYRIPRHAMEQYLEVAQSGLASSSTERRNIYHEIHQREK